MRPIRNTITTAIAILLLQVIIPAYGQMGISFDIKKPKEYDERVLRSEKSDQKKFTLPRRFIQNTVTHFNYYYNANLKLNEVLERAKEAFKDDYSRLLPFYNYSLDVTAGDSIQLDSITYKSSTGIALHDLRNDWVDNLYLLWGASFYLQKKFDSAYLMFQFINYAFAQKEKDGYYKTIGSGKDGNSALSISTKEKNSLPKKIFSEPPSRNDAFIWQIRNHLAIDEMAEAASLIVALKSDPLFPKRLFNDLHEVQAYWFYKQSMWDSAAVHLEQALSNATNKQEKARWEYLTAQLYEMSGHNGDAEKLYSKVSGHTTDPILDIYARLAAIRVDKDGGDKSIEKNVAELERMAKRDKYLDYRDIIYYMAAQMQLLADSKGDGSNYENAINLLIKSTQYASNNPAQRNKAFLQLAEMTYNKQRYRQSYNFYDSIQLGDTSIRNPEEITARKKSLGILATNMEIIERQDSLQRVAGMAEEERKEFVKKLVKQLRKQQGLKEESGLPLTNPIATPTLFPTGNNQPKGEWYFYNTAARTRGLNEFKSRWGTRPNIDNWRRSSAVGAAIISNQQQLNTDRGVNQQQNSGEITFDGLYDNLPLTPEKIKASDDSIQKAMFALGKVLIQEIENCTKGTETLEQLRTRYPAFDPMDEVLFNLYYCYNKYGETSKAAAVKKLMGEKYSASNFTTIVTTGKNPQSKSGNTDATKKYEAIYDLFIEGKFNQAIAEKKAADSVYGKNYWTPQLLYIEAVYYIKQREDSTAKTVLSSIINQFAGTPLALKAANLLSVLERRAQIEEELEKMVVTRAVDSSATKAPATVTPVAVIPKPVTDTTKKTNPTVITTPTVVPPKDTVAVKPPIPNNTPFTNAPNEPHYVVLVLNKVDVVFSNEAKQAFSRFNRDNFYNKSYSLDLFELNPDNRLLLISPFATAADALIYIDKAKPRTAAEIVPWLKDGKYYYAILNQANFELLKKNQNLEGYKTFLNQYFPGKF